MSDGQTESPLSLPPTTSRIFNNKTRVVLIGVVLALALVYLLYSAFVSNAVYIVTVGEFLADENNMDGRSVRVEGKLVPGSFQRVPGTTQANFRLSDEGKVLEGTYDGVFPDLFFNPYSTIVLEGSYGNGGVFQTGAVLVKCPSKYQALKEQA